MTIHNINRLLNTEEAANILHLSPDTLTVWRAVGRYSLKFVKVGRAVRYREQDIHDFIEQQTKDGQTDGYTKKRKCENG